MLLKEGLQATAFVIVNFAFCLYHILSYNILQAVLVASRKALIQRKGALDITQEILERLEARFEGCWSAGIIWTAGVHNCGKLSWEKKSD